MSVRILCVLALCLNLSACVYPQASRVVVEKSARQMVLLDHEGKVMRSYAVALGFDPVGPKLQEGDGKTPEGEYFIAGRNPKSRYYRSLAISYPGPQDKMRAGLMGVKPGNHIMIHGFGDRKASYRRFGDWTEGCVAVSNSEITEIWNMVGNGTPVTIRP
jgi:murein L,D-transpeptidase YafK